MCVVTVTAAPGDSESGDLHETCCVQGEAHTALGILPSRMRAWSTDGLEPSGLTCPLWRMNTIAQALIHMSQVLRGSGCHIRRDMARNQGINRPGGLELRGSWTTRDKCLEKDKWRARIRPS